MQFVYNNITAMHDTDPVMAVSIATVTQLQSQCQHSWRIVNRE